MREAVEINLTDSPSGGTTMAIVTPTLSYDLRMAKDGQVRSHAGCMPVMWRLHDVTFGGEMTGQVRLRGRPATVTLNC